VFSMILSACSPASTAFVEMAKRFSIAQAASAQAQDSSSPNSEANPSTRASTGTESTATSPSISAGSDLWLPPAKRWKISMQP
jgi:hypothetical protein